MYSVRDTAEAGTSQKAELFLTIGSNFNIYVASIVFVLNFKRLTSIFTKGNNTSPASPATAPAAAAAAAATAAAALAALPDLEPDPIYNISIPPPPLRVTEEEEEEEVYCIRASITRSGTSTRKSARLRKAFVVYARKPPLRPPLIRSSPYLTPLPPPPPLCSLLGELRAEPTRAELERAEPERAEPERAEPELTKG
ncbi:hypothetical protein BT67DRAFT_434993 [Trichocladium antarcticum]|uniref:Uncharacterized protein n=1 Tax=Trichocladium antarcticum TaxID=1450529 RepID=A0AAN6ZD53_9PEZI|nr:hypothetical protein BT67DRAFT_434993 [Trichocladium antarcticum]